MKYLNLEERFVSEGKQVGDLYRFMNIGDLLASLDRNFHASSLFDISNDKYDLYNLSKYSGYINKNYNSFICFTRDKEYFRNYKHKNIPYNFVRCVFDGDKLSDKYRISPIDYQMLHFSNIVFKDIYKNRDINYIYKNKLSHTKKDKKENNPTMKMINKSYYNGDVEDFSEREERIWFISNKDGINNFTSYLKRIDILFDFVYVFDDISLEKSILKTTSGKEYNNISSFLKNFCLNVNSKNIFQTIDVFKEMVKYYNKSIDVLLLKY